MKQRVRFFKKIQDWILKSERLRKQILLSLLRSSIEDPSDHDASKEPKNPLAEWILWIVLFNKETQNPFSVFFCFSCFGLKNQILNIRKETHPNYLPKGLMKRSRLESKKCPQDY